MRVTCLAKLNLHELTTPALMLKINYKAPPYEIFSFFRLRLLSQPSLLEYHKYYTPFAPTYFQFLHFGWF